jgi:hypothetical protein
MSQMWQGPPPGLAPDQLLRFQQEAAYVAQYGQPPPPGMNLSGMPGVGAALLPPPLPPKPPQSRPTLAPPAQPPAGWQGVEISTQGPQHDSDEDEDYSDLVGHLTPGERRHSSLVDLDMDDLHEIHEGDLAELDTGTEDADEAGIIDDQSGLNVQPAVPIKEEDLAAPAAQQAPAAAKIPEATTEPAEVVRRRSRAESARTHFLASQAELQQQDAAFPGEEPQPPSRRTSRLSSRSTAGTAGVAGAALVALGGASMAASQELGSLAPIAGSTHSMAERRGSSSGLRASASAMLGKVIASTRTMSSHALDRRPSATAGEKMVEQPVEPLVVEAAGGEPQEQPLPQQLEREEEFQQQEPTPEVQDSAPEPVTAPPAAMQQPRTMDPTHVVLKARTLAGKVFPLGNLDREMTFFELREIIHEAVPTIPVHEQRLLFKGKIIDAVPNASTLREIGFRDGDLIHVVRQLSSTSSALQQLSSSSPQQDAGGVSSSVGSVAGTLHSWGGSASPALGPVPGVSVQDSNVQMLTVLVPAGRRTGDRLRIHPPGRQPMLVTVPEGVSEGMPFRVQLPPLTEGQQQQRMDLPPLPAMAAPRGRVSNLDPNAGGGGGGGDGGGGGSGFVSASSMQHQQQQQQQMMQAPMMDRPSDRLMVRRATERALTPHRRPWSCRRGTARAWSWRSWCRARAGCASPFRKGAFAALRAEADVLGGGRSASGLDSSSASGFLLDALARAGWATGGGVVIGAGSGCSTSPGMSGRRM